MPSVLKDASKYSVLFTIPNTYANSSIVKTAILSKTILKLLKTGHARNIHTLADRAHPSDMASTLSILDPESIKKLFDNITDNKTAAKIIASIKDKGTIAKTFAILKRERVSEILSLINPDDGADLIGSLPSREAEALLKLVKKDTASIVRGLLKYPADTAGGIMNTKYILLEKTDTVGDAIRELKIKGHNGSYINIYIKDTKQGLCGFLPVSSLFSYSTDTPLSKTMNSNIVPIDLAMRRNSIITTFNRYKIMETAVIDKDNNVVGIITSDDISAIIEEETSKDVQEISGSIATKNPLKARLPISMISFILVSIASYIAIDHISFLDSQVVELLSIFPLMVILPAILAFQASSSTSRDFDIGLLDTSDFYAIIKIEMKIGIFFGLLLSSIIAAALYFYFGPNIKDHVVISLCFFTNIVFACLFGGLFPFIFRKKSSSYLIVSAPIIIGTCVIITTSIYLALSKYLLSLDIIPNTWKIF